MYIIYMYIKRKQNVSNRLILTSKFRTNLVRGLSNKEMEFQNKEAVPVQIAPLLISQPRNQHQSIMAANMIWFLEGNPNVPAAVHGYAQKCQKFTKTRGF